MRKNKIVSIIQNEFDPVHFEVINESDMHQGPPGRETHFKLVIVSSSFFEQSRVERHQALYKLLADELKSGLHALSLKLYTPQEWSEFASQSDLQSPDCSHKK